MAVKLNDRRVLLEDLKHMYRDREFVAYLDILAFAAVFPSPGSLASCCPADPSDPWDLPSGRPSGHWGLPYPCPANITDSLFKAEAVSVVPHKHRTSVIFRSNERKCLSIINQGFCTLASSHHKITKSV